MIRPRRHAVVFWSRIGTSFELCCDCSASLAGLRCAQYREAGALRVACTACCPLLGTAPTRSAS